MSDQNILLSGGAEGADTYWTLWAESKGHEIVNWTFDGHRSSVRHQYVLTQDQLNTADEHILRANKFINRCFPTKNQHVNNLLRRNYFQIATADRIYAVGKFSNDNSAMHIDGGTAWACQMYVLKYHSRKRKSANKLCECYFFDQTNGQWYAWSSDTWIEIKKVPTPHGIYAGVGTRKLNDKGRIAIFDL